MSTCEFQFSSVMMSSFICRATEMRVANPIEPVRLGQQQREADIWGFADIYRLVVALDGGIYMMGYAGRVDPIYNFEVTSINDSPRIFLPPTLSANTVWSGGMLGSSTMITEAANVTSPGLITGCYKFSERFTDTRRGNSIALNWWYLPGSGFVDRYNMDTTFMYSRTPFSNG